MPFSSRTADVSRALSDLKEGDNGAAILDGIAFDVEQLGDSLDTIAAPFCCSAKPSIRAAKRILDEALRLISDTNTAMYSFGFSSTRAAVSHEAEKFDKRQSPGPAHGCFSREGTIVKRRALQQASAGLHQPACASTSIGHNVISRSTHRATHEDR